MANNKVKISKLPIKDELDGQEVFPIAYEGSNFGVTLDGIRDYIGYKEPIVMTQAEYDALLVKDESQTYYIVD